MSLLCFKNFSVKNLQGKYLLRDVTFSIPPHKTIGLVGESGAGKSTLGLAALGLLSHAGDLQTEGEIFFEGVNIVTLGEEALCGFRASEISMIFQDPGEALNPVQTVEAHLKESILIHNPEILDLKERVQELLDLVHLKDKERYLKSYPFQLSGGEAQRVMIAMALANNPKLLIADEPTTALDKDVEREILVLLKALQKKTTLSILFISHDLPLVESFSDQVITLEQGQVVEGHFERGTKRVPRKLPPIAKGKTPLLEVRSLSVSYSLKRQSLFERKKHHLAVKRASFTIDSGEIVGLVGASGCGKTTLSKALMGLLPHTGLVSFEGCPFRGSREQRGKFQMVFQTPASSLNPKWTVEDIIKEGLIVHFSHLSEEEQLERIGDVLWTVQLNLSYLSRYPGDLSGGEAQRVALARGLVLDPLLMILDEPTASLDQYAQQGVLDLIHTLRQRQETAFLIISHDEALIKNICHRTLFMDRGVVTAL